MSRDRDLMHLHVEALFAHDPEGRLTHVNEPNGAPAPRFFLGRTVDGPVRRFRTDVPDAVRRDLENASQRDVPGSEPLDAPTSTERYTEILARLAPVRHVWTGPAFHFPQRLRPTSSTIRLEEANAELLRPLLREWLPDVHTRQPVLALVVDGRAVAVCCSGRRTDRAHEAAVGTAPGLRGRGYATTVVTAWARAVREMDREPLYSTSWENTASLAVARKLGLVLFGSDLHLT